MDNFPAASVAMSRFKNLGRSLASGYLALGTNVLYTLASVPLALHYLSKAEFGLWALTSQMAGFLALIDLGMGSSIARILIDHKDQRETGQYGGAIKTGVLVGAVQGAIVLVVGLVLVFFLGGWLLVPDNLSREFFWLMAGQVFIAALSFVSRTFGQVLYAWQRLDLQNYAQVFQFALWLGVLWLGFAGGLGVYSLLLSTAAGWLGATVICAVACLRLHLWPKTGEWGRVSVAQFREIFSYATDLFLIAIGTQLIVSSQTVLITRMLGLEAVAIWTAMTKAYTLVNQIIAKIIATAMPALAEMQVRQETTRLWDRYRGLFVTVNVIAAVSAVGFAACNGLFVTFWLNGKIGWPIANDILLAAWMLVSTQQCAHNSFISCLKQIREIKYTFLLEGAVFTVAAVLVLPHAGLPGMLICSLVCTLLFTFANGAWRVSQLAKENHQPSLWRWQVPMLRELAILLPCWGALAWLLRDTPVWLHLLIAGSGLLLAGGLAAIRFALPSGLMLEMAGKLPAGVRRKVNWILPGMTQSTL